MKLQVLGASGGIGGSARTTSLLIDDDILIDAGTGLGELPLAALEKIDHVFLTHSHLDHLACLPFMMDTVGSARDKPIVVHAQEVTLEVLRKHLFSGSLWPDFAAIPTPEAPFMKYETLRPGTERSIGTRRLRSVPVTHTVPAVGYLVHGQNGGFAFSGDTTTTAAFWDAVNADEQIRHVIIETSFLDEDEALTRIAKHLCPKLLAEELKKLTRKVQVHITHLFPGAEDEIMAEIARHVPTNTPKRLMRGEVIDC